jgi:hypothetical protein
MTDINVFPHIDTLSSDVLFLAYDPTSGLTGNFTVGELKTFLGVPDQPATDTTIQDVIEAIEATGVILTEAQKTACGNRITAAKANGSWDKRIGFYGFLGGTAASNAINWKSPGTYDLVWSGEVAHSPLGVAGNGVNAYGATGFNPSAFELLTSKSSLSFYSRTNNADMVYDAGIRRGGNQWSIHLRWSNGICYFDSPLTPSRLSSGVADSLGAFTGSIKDTEAFFMKRDALIVAGNVPIGDVSIFDASLDFMRANADDGSFRYSTRQYGLFAFGYELTQAQVLGEHEAEQAYQSALGRSV